MGSDLYLRKILLAAVGHPRDEGLTLGLLFLILPKVAPSQHQCSFPKTEVTGSL